MIELNETIVIHILDGDRTRPVAGKVIGRTREETPHYDVFTDEGIFTNVPLGDVEQQA